MIPVRTTEDGRPIHPVSGRPMVEVELGRWMDPLGKRIVDWLNEAALALVDAMVEQDEPKRNG